MKLILAGLAFVALHGAVARAQTGRISGVVIEDGTNLPVSGAEVLLRIEPSPPPPFRVPDTGTDAQGRFTFNGVAVGHYRVEVHATGFVPPTPDVVLPTVDVVSDEELTNVVVIMQQGGVISGRVLDPSGKPIVNMGVTALLKRPDSTSLNGAPSVESLRPLGQCDSNEYGAFRVEGLPTGDYIVAAHPVYNGRELVASMAAMGTTYYPGSTDESAAQTVSVQSGQIVEHITFRVAVAQMFRVSGVVADDAGARVPNAFVMIMPDVRRTSSFGWPASGPNRSAQSDASGAFVLEGIPAGTYTLTVVPGESGSVVAIRIKNADVSDVKLVVKRQPTS